MKFTRIKAGEKFVMREGAYNAFCDAAEANVRRSGLGSTASGGNGPALIVNVKNNNNDGSDLDEFAAVTCPQGWDIGGLPLTLEGQEFAVNAAPVLNGQFDVNGYEDPTGPILITQEPIPFGSIGRAAIGGVTVAMVDIDTIGHDYAEYDATTNKLASTTSGRVRILAYSDPLATGDQFCLVHLQQSTQKLASYTGLPSYGAPPDGGDFIYMTAIAAGYTTLFTGSFPKGWYDVEIHGNGVIGIAGATEYAQLEFERDTGSGVGSILPATGSSRMSTSYSAAGISVPTPYSIRFLHYVDDDTDSYRLRAFVTGSTFTGIATLTLTPTVRRVNMTVPYPP